MFNRTKEYKADKKTQRTYVILLLIIAIPLIIFCINSVVESSNKIAANDNNIEHMTIHDVNGDMIIKSIMYQNDVKKRNTDVLFFMFCIGALFFILHFYFFTNTKLLLDEEGISLYSIYKKEPSKVFLWKDIKSIQFGDIYTPGSRIPGYKMKIRCTKMTDNELNNFNDIIPIKKFQDYNNIIKDIEQIGKQQNIDVFYMND